MLEVLDTAGQEEYTALRDQWIRDGEGFVLVYSISSRSSFSRIKRFHHQIQRVKESCASSPSYPGSPIAAINSALGGRLSPLAGAAVEKPLKADIVADAVVEALEDDAVKGPVDTARIEELATRAWRRGML